MTILNNDWEFNVLGVYNYKKDGPFSSLFNFVKENHDKIDGDIVESGVYKGSSLLAMGLLLKEIGSSKKVYGFDSFSGFPPVFHDYDDVSMFAKLFNDNRISRQHYDYVQKNINWRETFLEQKVNVNNISSSENFSNTNLDLIYKKMKLLELDNIQLVDGVFSKTMVIERENPKKVMAVLMDCDLYNSYMDTFNFVWSRLNCGGMIYLDEYYSLKFPGAKIATEEFLKKKSGILQMAKQKKGDFERWYIIKK